MLQQHAHRILSAARAVFPVDSGVSLAAKIAGIHWWYGMQSHAAELTGSSSNFSQ